MEFIFWSQTLVKKCVISLDTRCFLPLPDTFRSISLFATSLKLVMRTFFNEGHDKDWTKTEQMGHRKSVKLIINNRYNTLFLASLQLVSISGHIIIGERQVN